MMETPNKPVLANRYFFSRGERASDDYQQFWIRYKPARVLRKRLKNLIRYQWHIHAGIAVIFVCLFAYCLTCSTTPVEAYLAVLVLFAAWLTSFIRPHMLPTHLALSEDGLRLHWLRTYMNLSSPLIGWDRLSHVSIGQVEGFIGKDTALEFNIISRGYNFMQRFGLALLAPELSDGWLTADRSIIRLKLDGIASSDDRKRLQMALKKFLPSYRIDSAVTDELNLAIRVESYTDLWLDALSLSPKRLRDTILVGGTHIRSGRYEIVRHIGGGGQAVVYEAVEKTAAGNGQIDICLVVLKEFVLPAHAGVNVRKRVLANIQREADLLKNLNHPNIVKLHDFFVDDQRAYLVLEHIDGKTLKEVVQKCGPINESEAVRLGDQMCDILVYLHSRKPEVVHRDFTPDNLMLDLKGNLKLIDFNVAQHLEADTTKSVVGKHAFIPPEQFRGQATPQSDIYSLGGTLFYILTGEEPEPITQSHVTEKNPAVSTDLDDIIFCATAQNCAERYPNCTSVKMDLMRLLTERYGVDAQSKV